MPQAAAGIEATDAEAKTGDGGAAGRGRRGGQGPQAEETEAVWWEGHKGWWKG